MNQKEWLMYLNKTALPLDKTIEVVYIPRQLRLRLSEVRDFPIGHRVMLPNELVMETDRPVLKENKDFALAIYEILKAAGIPFTLGFSGHRSYHFHIFLCSDVKISPEKSKTLKENGFNFHDLTQRLGERLFDAIQMVEVRIFGDTYLDYQKLYKNQLIREFGGVHEETGRPKTFMNSLDDDVNVLRFPEKIEFWNCQDKLKQAVYSWKPKRNKTYEQVFSR
jgi:hypothetical protein